MKLKFRIQKFQSDAAQAVCDVFAGQPYSAPTYRMDSGIGEQEIASMTRWVGFGNAPISLEDDVILKNIRKIQAEGQIKPSDNLEGQYNLTVEMETGVGKTYTYIKTMYELQKRYGWSKFVIVVPSVAIREGVYKSFQITEDHFKEIYGKSIRYFIYNSSRLNEIDHFASDNAINAMIINTQAFNARGKDARRINMKLDEFRSRKPIDILAATRPILIIDEPQSVEGKATKSMLEKYRPLMTLRYSATHKVDSIYNMVYRLDAIDAYNKKLVKKIAVKGIAITEGAAISEGYLYLQSINLSQNNPTATIEYDIAGQSRVRKATRIVSEGYNLYDHSGQLDQYKNGYIISRIDGRDLSIELVNGKKLYVGEVIGKANEEQYRRIQVRETILSHLEREKELYRRGIKVLSLFFIDEVAKYRMYNDEGKGKNGLYADIFEEEYDTIVRSLGSSNHSDKDYLNYLHGIVTNRTHEGYFSIDKSTNRLKDVKVSGKETTSDDVDAYDLIMKNKERLLDHKEPVRFIFSHSALREGWDNPNVFQICTLKQSGSEIRKRQEVGRGLRLAVNQNGERMDENMLSSNEVHNVNVLTIIASESYESFAKSLQDEIAQAIGDRPRTVTAKLFIEDFGVEGACQIHESLVRNNYISMGKLTENFFLAKANNEVILPDHIKDKADIVLQILNSVYDHDIILPENARRNNIEVSLNEDKMNSKAFQELWKQINRKSAYTVSFEEEELVEKAVIWLDEKLSVTSAYYHITRGEQTTNIESLEQLQRGEAFNRIHESREKYVPRFSKSSITYDLIGKIVDNTGLTRNAVATILLQIRQDKFNLFKENPEEFVLNASKLINEQKATIIIERISYNKLTDEFDSEIFTYPDLKKAELGKNAMTTERHLYSHVIYDSEIEKKFAENLEIHKDEVEVYVKLPNGFYIDTPVGKYNPDWAIAFYEGKVKHVYFVAETKGSISTMDFRSIEKAKIHCAREHFKAISGENVKYDVISNYNQLWALVQPQ